MSSEYWFPWYPARYERDTLHLDHVSDSCYRRLIDWYMEHQKALPSRPESLANLVALPHDQFTSSVWPKLQEFFSTEDDGLLHHKRCDVEIARQQRMRKQVKEAARQSVKARWGDGVSVPPGYSNARSGRLAEARKLGTHTEAEWQALCDVFGNACVRCNANASDLVGGVLCKDHVQPIFRGGSDAIDNIQPMCKSCNSGKQADKSDYRGKIPDWRERVNECLRNAYGMPTRMPPKCLRMPTQDSRGQDIDISTTVPNAARDTSPVHKSNGHDHKNGKNHDIDLNPLKPPPGANGQTYTKSQRHEAFEARTLRFALHHYSQDRYAELVNLQLSDDPADKRKRKVAFNAADADYQARKAAGTLNPTMNES